MKPTDASRNIVNKNGMEAKVSEEKSLNLRATATDRERFPDLNGVRSVILKEGPRSRKEAKYTEILNRHTGEVHHHALTIKTFRKRQGEWNEDVEHSITLSTEDDEIQMLSDFLTVVRDSPAPTASADFLVVPAPDGVEDKEGLRKLLSDLSLGGKANALADILSFAAQDSNMFRVLLERAAKEPQLFADAAAALNLVTYKNAVDELRGLINVSGKVREAQFQALLTEHPWMFGSEYSELLDKRRWTRDEQQDFVVRRTADNYIELIEIKTPLGGEFLFRHDTSHNSFYSGVELSKVVGQVQNYIEKLDAERHAIIARDGEDTCKIRAKIIIGRDGDENQRQALRRFNGHLHRIEVLTFDQLLRTAENVLSYLRSVVKTDPDSVAAADVTTSQLD